MVHRRLALGAGLALSLAQPALSTDPFGFPTCVSNCVKSTGCESQSTKCVCKEARDDFLEDVVTCLYYHCQPDLHKVNDVFFTPVKSACDAAKSPIPKDELQGAEKEAASYIAKLPKTTTAKEATKAPPVPIKTATTSSSRATQTTTNRSSSSSTSSTETAAPTTRVVAPPPLLQSSIDSPTTTANAPGRVPTDSSPFATFNSAGSRVEIGWAALALLLAMALK